MRQRVSAAAFYLLCILMSPLMLAGYVIWVAKGIATRRSKVSVTAQGPLAARFTEHNFGTRQDEAADRLMRALPSVPSPGLRLTTGPAQVAHRLTGYVPKAFRYPFEGDVPPLYEASARIGFFDAAVDRHLPDVAHSTPPARERLAELLRSCGLSLIEQRTLGEETPTQRAWGGFATARVEGD